MDANLVRRVAFAAVAIPLALIVIWYGGLPLVCLLALAGALGTGELFGLASAQGVKPARVLGIAAAAAVAPLTYAAIAGESREQVHELWPFAAAIWLILVLIWALAATAEPAVARIEAVAVTGLAWHTAEVSRLR